MYLSSGFNSNLALFRNGGTGPWRLLMQESFGYSILDLTNPISPVALYYHDVRNPVGGPNSIPQHGDGQNMVQTIAVSPDGQRAAFSTTGPAAPFNTVVGKPDGASGFTLWGDFFIDSANGTVVQLDSEALQQGLPVNQIHAHAGRRVHEIAGRVFPKRLLELAELRLAAG